MGENFAAKINTIRTVRRWQIWNGSKHLKKWARQIGDKKCIISWRYKKVLGKTLQMLRMMVVCQEESDEEEWECDTADILIF